MTAETVNDRGQKIKAKNVSDRYSLVNRARGKLSSKDMDVTTRKQIEHTANRLRLLRVAFGLTQEEMAAKLGISRNAWNQYEKGRRVPSPFLFLGMCEADGISIEWIYRGQGRYDAVRPSATHSLYRVQPEAEAGRLA